MPVTLPYNVCDQVVIIARENPNDPCVNAIGEVVDIKGTCACIRSATGVITKTPAWEYYVRTTVKVKNVCNPDETYCFDECKPYCEDELRPLTTTP